SSLESFRPYFFAQRRAVAGEMAMSPRYSPACTVFGPRRSRTGFRRATMGKDSTSVGPFFLRNISFIRAISASLTRQTVRPASSNPSSFFTWRRNDSSGRLTRRTVRWRFRIILVAFLFLVLYRVLSLAYLLCHWRCFRLAAGELHH